MKLAYLPACHPSVCLFVLLSIRLSVCLSDRSHVHLLVGLFIHSVRHTWIHSMHICQQNKQDSLLYLRLLKCCLNFVLSCE